MALIVKGVRSQLFSKALDRFVCVDRGQTSSNQQGEEEELPINRLTSYIVVTEGR